MIPLLDLLPAALAGDPWLGDRVPAGAIAEIRPRRSPPEVRLHDGRIGFVSAVRRRELEAFAEVHGIPLTDPTDVWALLTEPYLDTESTPAEEASDLARLAAEGFPAEEVAAIRRMVRFAMLALTSMTWEWVHYGLYDVLTADPGRWLPRPRRDARYLPPDHSAAGLRRWAEGVANRAAPRPYRVERPTDDAARSALRWRFPAPALGSASTGSGWIERSLAGRTRTEPLRDALLDAWCGPGRAYHGPRHLLAVLDDVAHAEDRVALDLAAWFHDALYVPGSARTEDRSAAWLERELAPLVAEGLYPAGEVALAARLVRATARPFDPLPVGPDAAAYAALLDADLGALASPPERYAGYLAAVRAEHAFLDDRAWNVGRSAFVEGVLAAVERRGCLFHARSPFAEHLARRNLLGEREALAREALARDA